MRDSNIDNVRLLGNVAILITHTYPFMYSPGHTREFWFWNFVSMNVCLMAMPAFFLISGYLMFVNFNGEGYIHKMKSRTKRLLLPMCLWNMIASIVLIIVAHFNASAMENAQEFDLFSLQGWLLQITVVGHKIVNAPLWYMRCVFVFTLIFPVFYLIFRYIRWECIVILGIVLTWMVPNFISSDYPTYGLVLFVFGGLAAFHHVSITGLVSKHKYLFLVISLFAVSYSCFEKYIADAIGGSSDICKLCGVPLFVLAAVALRKRLECDLIRKYILPTGFVLYLYHFPVNQMIMHFVGRNLPIVDGTMSIVVMTTVGCTLTFGIILWHLLYRCFPRILSILEGKI